MSEVLPAHLVRLLERAVAGVPREVASAVVRQAVRARVVAEVQGRSVDVEVPEDEEPVPVGDGPLRPIASVVGPAGESTGELLVWVRGGRLIGLERPWWTDDAPTQWPAEEDVRQADAT